MKNGFVEEIHSSNLIDEFSLFHLTKTSALGACYLAAEKINCDFVKPYDTNVKSFFHYKRDHYPEIEWKNRMLELKNHTAVYDTIVSANTDGNRRNIW